MNFNLQASCNWTLSGGCEISKAIKTVFTNEDIFIKPSEDEIIQGDTAVLLNKPQDGGNCELQFKLCPRFKIFSISLACNASKIEIFQGTRGPETVEYAETVYGDVMTDNDADESPLVIYRYDIEVTKSGIVEMILKLFANTDEVCIFGIYMQIAANPNGVTTLSPNTPIDLDNVQQLLKNSEHKISENAKMLKTFMHSYIKQQQFLHDQGQQQQTVLPEVNFEEKNEIMPIMEAEDSTIRTHFDTRLKELEDKIFERLDRMHTEYVAKLDKICDLLETKTED